MGKRKTKTKVIKIRAAPLATAFDCLACHESESVVVKLDNKNHLGNLRCRACNFVAQYKTNSLDRPVDVYSKWVDEAYEHNTAGGLIPLDDDGDQTNFSAMTNKAQSVHTYDDDGEGPSTYYGDDQTEVAGGASEDEYDGDDLDILDEEIVTSEEEGEDEEKGSSHKKDKKHSKKDRKEKKDKKHKKQKTTSEDSGASNELVQLPAPKLDLVDQTKPKMVYEDESD